MLNVPGTYQFTGGNLALLNNVIPNLQMVGGTVSLGLNFQGGTITNLTAPTLSGNYTVSGTLNCSGGVAGNLTVANGGLVNWTGGNISSNLAVQTGGLMNWSGGSVLGSLSVLGGAAMNWSGGNNLGPITVASNGVLNITGGGVKFLRNVLTNAGTVPWSGADTSAYGARRVGNMAASAGDVPTDRNSAHTANVPT